MAKKESKREQTAIIEGLKDSNNIQKSTPLLSLWKSSLGLGSFKVLDTYLSRINSRYPDRREVKFRKKELEALLGITEVKPAALQRYTDELLREIVDVDDPTCDGGFNRISLFSQSKCYRDEYGEYWVTLSCTPEAMKYFFNVEQLGYLRYKLRNVLQITSRYSYVLFLYLFKRRRCKPFDVSIDELRELLQCTNDPYYNEFKNFNRKILKRCCDEINEKTELKYSYEPVRAGRKVGFIRFTIEKTGTEALDGEQPPSGEQLSLEECVDRSGEYQSETLGFLAEACNFAFDETAMKVIFDEIAVVIPEEVSSRGINVDRYDFLSRCYHVLLDWEREHPVNDRKAYLLGIIKKGRK